MKTTAVKTPTGYRLNGAKMWISNAPAADVFVVWAKSEAHGGKIRGFVLDKGTKGLSAPVIKGKLSLRASITGEIVMSDVDVGEDALLPNVEGLKGTVWLFEPRALRNFLGCDGRCRGMLARSAAIWFGPPSVR
jgi:glutaryl-CoA dehydrogenase